MAEIRIIKGDITERETDTIINASNDMLILGSGLGGAIRAKGGKEIVEELSRYKHLDLGKAVITGSGKLKTKHIIHVALNRFDESIDVENIYPALINAFKLASSYSLKSISIPDMSMGIMRVSPQKAAEKIFSAIKDFLATNKSSSIELYEIVLWDMDTLYIYRDVYEEFFEV